VCDSGKEVRQGVCCSGNVYAIGAAVGFARCDRTVAGREVSLCLTCTNAVVTGGTRGQEWIACNFGGAMRRVKFTVCSCTG